MVGVLDALLRRNGCHPVTSGRSKAIALMQRSGSNVATLRPWRDVSRFGLFVVYEQEWAF